MLINCTPHDLHFVTDQGVVTLARSEHVARAAELRESCGALPFGSAWIPLNIVHFGELSGLPDPVENTWYVVSLLAANAARANGRADVLTVDLMVRDEEGRIVGATALARA